MTRFSRAVIGVIHVYQHIFSPDRGIVRYLIPTQGICVMYPSCSTYMIGAIERYGVVKGVFRGIRRILRCHPYQKKLVDPP